MSYEFQSTHPRGVRQCNVLILRAFDCFNPRTHAGCDFSRKLPSFASSVSIHAPTRGATLRNIGLTMYQSVSIHAPTRGATCPDNKPSCSQPCFNPRTHAGCDEIIEDNNPPNKVSIHAPTRGATLSIIYNYISITYNHISANLSLTQVIRCKTSAA